MIITPTKVEMVKAVSVSMVQVNTAKVGLKTCAAKFRVSFLSRGYIQIQTLSGFSV